ncbi:glycosyltransferase family 39 protein [Candidatus Parcubacteria bacterium]|nr:glycosyltransferase family 39 protein [Candidatus Parcubacteria bacterium]
MFSLLKKYNFFLILFILFLFSTFFWWYFFGGFNLGNDGDQYNELALSMLNDGSFSINGEISMMREPGYPFFIYLIYQLFGVSIFIVCVFQAFIHFAIVLLTYYLTDKIFNKKIARISSILVILFPNLYILSSTLLSEVFACFLVMMFFLFYYLAQRKNANIFFALASLFLGGLVLVKSMFALFVIFVVIIIFLNEKSVVKKFGYKKPLLMFLFFALVVFPWIARSYTHFNEVSIASRGGNMIYTRALKNLYSFDESLKYTISVLSGEYIVRRYIDNNYIFEESWADSSGLNAFTDNINNSEDKNNYDKLDILMRQESKRLILEHPFKYLYYGIVEISNLNSPMIYQEKHFSIFHDNIYSNTFVKVLCILIMRLIWLIFLSMAIYGIINIVVKRKKNAYIFVLMIFYVNGILFFLQGNPRFLIPIFPIYLILASFGFCKIINKCHIKLLKKIC